MDDFKPYFDPCTACPARATHHLNMGYRVSMCDKHYEAFISWDLDID